MPVTPFHFGLGVLAKAAAPARVSLAAFIASQVVIDCETAYNIVTDGYPLHAKAHTFVLGTPIGLAAGLFASFAMRAWNRAQPSRTFPPHERDIGPVLVGGGLGGASHPFLDGIMHSDIRPFWPWLDDNPLLDLVGMGTLHLGLMAMAAAGIAVVAARSQAHDG